MIARTRLDSGLRVVTESLPELRSVTIGAWVGSGARDETDHEWGASHFLEHLLFKGTEDRSALEIAEAIESVGGEMNAFTTHEQTVFYVRVPDVQLDRAFDVLADVLWHPAFRPDDIESERQVILEEIGMRDDTPDDLVHDLFADAMFPEHPLGREVLGIRGVDHGDGARRHRRLPRRALHAVERGARGGRQPHARRAARAGRPSGSRPTNGTRPERRAAACSARSSRPP